MIVDVALAICVCFFGVSIHMHFVCVWYLEALLSRLCFQFVLSKVIQSNVVVVSWLCFDGCLYVWLLRCARGFFGALWIGF